MLNRFSSTFRQFAHQARHNRGRIAAKISRAKTAAIETLEQRVFLSVSASVLSGPVTIAGNTWAYTEYNQSAGVYGSSTFTSKGIVNHNGLSAVEIDIAYTNANGAALGTQTNFYAFLPQGFVLLETDINTSAGTDNEVWNAPYHIVTPAELMAGVPFTTPSATATDTVTTTAGAPTTYTEAKSDVITLQSETPSAPVTVPAGNFNCYQTNSTETDTVSGGTPSTDMSQTFVDPTDGMVETNDLTTGNIIKLTKFTGTSFHLAVTQPSSTLVDDKIDPGVQVSIQNSAGAIDTDASDAVTITASIGAASTGTGTLGAPASVTTVDGVAIFSNLSINKPGQYVLTFTDSTGRTVSTAAFQVTAGKLRFKGRISNGIVGESLEPAVEIELVNSKNQPITDAPSFVTLNISGGSSTVSITGNTAQQTNGIAIFRGLKIGTPGKYTLTATDDQGDVMAISNEIEITGLSLVFTEQPRKAAVNAPLKYRIELEDARHRLVNDSSIGLGLTLITIAGGTNAVINPPADTIDFGKASNSGGNPASINVPGTYQVSFSVISQTTNFDYAIDPITSREFVVVQDHLAFVAGHEPASTEVGDPLHYEVEMVNYLGQRVIDNADQIQLTLIPVNGSAGVLSTNLDNLIQGLAMDFNKLITINLVGKYKIMVTDNAPPGSTVAEAVTSRVFEIEP